MREPVKRSVFAGLARLDDRPAGIPVKRTGQVEHRRVSARIQLDVKFEFAGHIGVFASGARVQVDPGALVAEEFGAARRRDRDVGRGADDRNANRRLGAFERRDNEVDRDRIVRRKVRRFVAAPFDLRFRPDGVRDDLARHTVHLRDGGDGGVALASARRVVENQAAQVDEILQREGVNRRQVEMVVRVAVFVKEVGLVQDERASALGAGRFGVGGVCGKSRRRGSERTERGGQKRSGERSFDELAAVEHRRGLLR